MNARLFRAIVMGGIVMLSSSVGAEGGKLGVYLRIMHTGEEDKPIGTVIVTTDHDIAASLRRDVRNRVYVLSDSSFLRLRQFLESEGKKEQGSMSCAPAKVAGFGTFEVSDRMSDGAVGSFCYVVPRRAAIETFKRMAALLSARPTDEGLLNEINGLILRIAEP